MDKIIEHMIKHWWAKQLRRWADKLDPPTNTDFFVPDSNAPRGTSINRALPPGWRIV